MSEKVAEAKKLFDSGYSCSQAVLAVFADNFGMDRNMAFMLSTSFAGGMGGKGYTCGSVTGAYMVIGLKYGRIHADDLEAKETTYKKIQEFDEKFLSKHSRLTCGALIGFEPEDYVKKKELKDAGIFASKCTGFVETAVEILEEIL